MGKVIKATNNRAGNRLSIGTGQTTTRKGGAIHRNTKVKGTIRNQV